MFLKNVFGKMGCINKPAYLIKDVFTPLLLIS